MQKRLVIITFLAIWVLSSYFNFKVFTVKTHYYSINKKEKNLLFFSENAFYYSFYDRLTRSENLGSGLAEFSKDDSVLYPDRINSLKEFNIAPEILLSVGFKLSEKFNLSIGPMDFYLYGVFSFVGLTFALVFLGALLVSGSYLAAFVSLALMVVSVPYSTRATIFPALRENFTVPLWLATLILIYLQTRAKTFSFRIVVLLTFLTAGQLLFWQFGVVNLLIALAGFLALNLNNKKVSKYLTLIIFGTVSLYVFVWEKGLSGGSHMSNFFMYRLGLIEADFHTMLYSCNESFSGIDLTIFDKLLKNMLIPFSILGLFSIVGIRKKWVWIIWVSIYFIMATISSRFLILAIPILAIVSSEAFNWDVDGIGKSVWKWAVAIVFVLSLFFYSRETVYGFLQQKFYVGYDQVKLIEWIEKNTTQQSVFASSMNWTPAIRLSANRKIVNNPFYESHQSRQRNLEVYQVYNRVDEAEYLKILQRIKVNYLVVDNNFCFSNMGRSCSLDNIFVNEKRNPSLPILCRKLAINSSQFKLVYSNGSYSVYEVL